MNFFARLKIECRKLNARYNGNAVALADYLASYRAGYAVMVRYGNSVYSAFLCYNNYIFNSDRTVA